MGWKVIDETGNQYGRLMVIGRASNEGTRAAWLCQCVCGNEVIVRGNRLRKGDVKSCGCFTTAKDEMGNRHGRLVVIERAPNKRRKAAWRCRCDCGNEVVVTGLELRRGTKSCGCINRLPEGEAAFNRVLRNMRRHAKRRNLAWQLTKDQMREITKQPCHYCGTGPAQKCQGARENGSYVYSGIDRKDSNQGYKADNVVPCCGTCNSAKRTMSVEEFKEWITKVYHYCVK